MCMRATALYLALACVLGLCFLPACEDTTSPPVPAPPLVIDSPEAVITVLARAYNEQDAGLLATLLASEPGAEYTHLPCGLAGETPWGSAEEIRILRRRLYPLPGLPLLPGEQLQGFRVTFTGLEDFIERLDLYSADGGLDGKLDPQRWRAVGARHSTRVFLDLQGTDYLVEGEVSFVVIQDLRKQAGDPGAFLLYRWEEICESP